MPQENVELVRGLQPGPEVDIAALVRDDKTAETARAAVASVFHDDFECITVRPGVRSTYRGFDGLRASWLDWLDPWDSYYTVIEDVIDLGDRVLVLVRDRGRRRNLAAEVELRAASLYTVRDGKVARVEAYTNRDDALKAVGLSEQDLQSNAP
jgi:ketosteroid isomerase-like protein